MLARCSKEEFGWRINHSSNRLPAFCQGNVDMRAVLGANDDQIQSIITTDTLAAAQIRIGIFRSQKHLQTSLVGLPLHRFQQAKTILSRPTIEEKIHS